MGKKFVIMVLFLASLMGYSQEHYVLVFDEFQVVVDPDTSLQNEMRFPITNSVVVMGGLNDLDGMGDYFNVFGSRLLVDSKKPTSNGEHALVLRREDGRNFYDLFPTLQARLIPVTRSANN